MFFWEAVVRILTGSQLVSCISIARRRAALAADSSFKGQLPKGTKEISSSMTVLEAIAMWEIHNQRWQARDIESAHH